MSSRAYPVSVMTRARELHAVDWSLDEIRRIIEREFGRLPSKDAVQRWVDDDYRQRKNAKVAAAQRAKAALAPTFSLRSSAPEHQAAFVRRLRDEGVTWCNVVRVCRVVFGGRWTVDRAKRLVGESTTWDRSTLKVAA